ncbi:MAG TPA: hypothetical protein DDZ83_20115 [Nitrospinae bacterium]|nr:hypothetical protein [Nitrospinota bacterium]
MPISLYLENFGEKEDIQHTPHPGLYNVFRPKKNTVPQRRGNGAGAFFPEPCPPPLAISARNLDRTGRAGAAIADNFAKFR